MEAAARPLPRLDTTPPVTKMYFADIASSPFYCGWDGRTGWAHTSIAGTEIEWKIEVKGRANIVSEVSSKVITRLCRPLAYCSRSSFCCRVWLCAREGGRRLPTNASC